MSVRQIVLLSVLLSAVGATSAEDGFSLSGKVGAFSHYLFDGAGAKRIAEFDVPGVVRQLVQMKVDYFGLTLGQNTGWMCAPNAAYDRICGYAPGERCTTRDLPAELIPRLKENGIALMLYLPCQPPNRDARAVTAFGLVNDPPNRDHVLTAECVRKWASVIEEWSVRYGEAVVAWWFDGGYPSVGMNDDVAAVYAAAAKKGNPKALVTFNEGVKHPIRPWTKAADYLAGEIDEPFLECCAGPRVNGKLWHAMTFLGPGWGARQTRYSDEAWIRWLGAVTGNGGAVTIDLGREKPSGLFHPAMVAQMSRVMTALRGKKVGETRVPNRRFAPQLTLRADGEVRCYGEEPDGRAVFLSSEDFGHTWQTRVQTPDDPGAVTVSEWVRWGAWGGGRRPNAQARFALIGGERLLSAKWDNRDDIENYTFREAGKGPVTVLQILKLADCTRLAALVSDAEGLKALLSKDDAETWSATPVGAAPHRAGTAEEVVQRPPVTGSLFERADGSLAVLLDDGTGSLASLRSTDRGKTWCADPSVPPSLATGALPFVLRLSDGRHFAIVNDRASRNKYRTALSADDGRTWSDAQTLTLSSLAPDASPAPTDALELPDGRILLALGPKPNRRLMSVSPGKTSVR